ncbi:hypothetical protein KC960_01140 [Candidatus Saccharibacteria bacterium]|nr:hypothetical protein [Candidatus Saccharibacteria bacterium]
MTGNFLGHDRGYAPDPKTIEVEAPMRVYRFQAIQGHIVAPQFVKVESGELLP